MLSGKMEVISTGYTPRVLQAKLHSELRRFNVICCHRRFGKTVFVINELIDKGLRNTRKNPQYAYFAPYYGQAKRVAWDMLKDYTKNIPGVTYNEQELRCDIPRAGSGDRVRIILLGADNPSAIRGMYFDGVVLDEFAEMDPTVWSQVIRPALSDRLGFAIFIGTPKGTNHFFDIYKSAKASSDGNWYVALFKASQTNIIAQSELDAAIASGMSDEEYEQEFECSFTAALVGAYYGKYISDLEKKGQICDFPIEAGLPVDTFWDLGISDSMSIWFLQRVGKEIRLVDYLEDANKGLEHYVRELKKKPYVYNEIVLPHDGGARELGTGRTRQETLQKLWPGQRITVAPKQSLADGITAVRLLLPKCWFHATNCAEGIDALKNYQQEWDPKSKMYKDKPKHDWSSHGADAFRLLAMQYRPVAFSKSVDLPRTSDNVYDIFGNGRGS